MHDDKTKLEAALSYAKRGWPVFPVHGIINGICDCGVDNCESPGKHPMTPHGFKDAICDLKQITSWWTQCPNANIGMPTGEPSKIFVLDEDPRHGGKESLADLLRQQSWLETVTSGTGGGGHHFFLQKPAGLRIPGSIGKIAPGLDVRCDGSYVVLPPSNHASGHPYRWIAGLGPEDVDIVSLPDWLADLATRQKPKATKAKTKQPKKPVTVKPTKISTDGLVIRAGQRNDKLTRLAGLLRRCGCSGDEIVAALLLANLTRVDPPLPEVEVRKIAESVSSYSVGVNIPTTITGDELLMKNIPEPTWVVEGFLPEGATIVAGKPKIGKGWFVLNLAEVVATGGKFLGLYRAVAGDVLLVAFEESERIVKKRLRMLRSGTASLARLHIVHSWPPGDAGADALDQWILNHPEARLVIIDTLAGFREKPSRNNANIYATDYEAIRPLQQVASSHGVAIVIVHHLRKGDSFDPLESISGSTGLTGAADSAMVLNRQRNSTAATLFVTGRDIAELTFDLEFDKGFWRLTSPGCRRSPEQQKILQALEKQVRPVTPAEIAQATGLDYGSVRQLLRKLLADKLVEQPRYGEYQIARVI